MSSHTHAHAHARQATGAAAAAAGGGAKLSDSALVRGFDRMTSLASTFVEGDAAKIVRRSPPKAHALSLAHAHLHLERVRLRLAFEQSSDALVFVDRRGKVTVSNARARELLGSHAHPGAPILEAFEPADRDRMSVLARPYEGSVHEAALLTARALEGDALLSIRVAHLDDERTAWTIVEASPSPHDTSQVDLRDALDRERKRSAELDRSLRDTRELLDRERRSCTELTRANTSMKRLLAMLAHDLRGPLNAVLGWSDLLRREHLDRRARDLGLAAIVRSARAQTSLVEELLDVARMSEGKLQVDLSICDLGRIAKEAVETVAPNAAEAGLSIHYVESAEDANVIGDPRRIEQVLSNLISNAMKYSYPGGRIDIVVSDGRQEHQDQDQDEEHRLGDYVRLDVIDAGRGISPSLLPRVFDWLTQDAAHPEDTRSGLGLGLYIVKQLIELQGGHVVAESAGEGHGATFRVFLRRAQSDYAEENAAERRAAEQGEELPLHGLSILLVGEDETTLALLASILRSRGARILEAKSVDMAAALMEHTEPNIVLCSFDEHDPESGPNVTSLRGLTSHCPTIFVVDSPGSLAAAEGQRCLIRPFEASTLVELVLDAVGTESAK